MNIPLAELEQVIIDLKLCPNPNAEYRVPVSMVLNLCIELLNARKELEANKKPE